MNLDNPKLALESIERQIAETALRLKALRKIRAGLQALNGDSKPRKVVMPHGQEEAALHRG